MPLVRQSEGTRYKDDRRIVVPSEIEHELRTPVTSIASAAEILRDNPDVSPETRNAFLDAIIEENARLTKTLEKLLLESETCRESQALGVCQRGI